MSSLAGLALVGSFGRGKATAAADTRIRVLVPGKRNAYTYLTYLQYTCGDFEHTLTMMRGQSFSTINTALAELGTALKVNDALKDGAGNALAASDLVAIELADGSWYLDIVSAWNGTTKTITLTNGIPAIGGGAAKGGRVISYGVAGDSGHDDYKLATKAGQTVTFPATAHVGAMCKSKTPNEPLVIDSNNANIAGTVEAVSAVHGVS